MSARAFQFVAMGFLALALLLLVQAPVAFAGEGVKVGLKPVGDSGVSGLATVSTTDDGKATVEMQLAGLTPGGTYQARLQAGSCDTPSASFGVLGTLQADAAGEARLSANSVKMSAAGVSVDLEFAGLADGDHLISIAGQTVVACGAIPKAEAAPGKQGGPQFKLGFKTLAEYIPSIVGQPLEDEHSAANGDSLQQTTTGLMVWRKADNWTAFTDGSMTWINGPEGVQVRPNGERFGWESR